MIQKQLNTNKPRSWFENANALEQPLNAFTRRPKRVNFMWVAKGSTRKVTILDDKPIANFRFHIDAENNWDKVLCIQQHDNCPICSVASQAGRFGKSKQYILVTVVDETPWTTKEGRVVPYTKKILAIENEKQRKVILKYAEKYGTTRGLTFEFMRTGEKGEGACGLPIFEEFLSNAEIVSKFGNEEIKAEDGKVIKEALSDTVPFDYGKLFPLPSAAEMRQTYGIAPPLGASDAEDEDSYTDDTEGTSDYDSLDDEIPF